MLKLKLEYFGHLMRRADSFEKTLMLGRIGSRRRREWQRMRWTCIWASSGSWWWIGNPGVLQSMRLQRVGHDWGTELNWVLYMNFSSLWFSYLVWYLAKLIEWVRNYCILFLSFIIWKYFSSICGNLPLNTWQNLAVKPSGLEQFFCQLVSISFLPVGLDRLSVSSWTNFNNLCHSWNLSITSRISNLLIFNHFSCFLIFIYIRPLCL